MRPGISIILSPADRRRLEALVGDRNVAQKHVWRARIVLHSADGIGTNGIMRRTGKSKTCVWRWQERFAQEGYDGLLRDKTRPSRIPPLGPEVAERVVALTLSDPPAEATHWVAAMMAKATGISVSSGAAHLARTRASAASGAAIQAFERSRLRRQTARCGRALRRPAGPRHRALGRRKVSYGRNAHCCAPPAQIRTWSLNHPAPTSGA